MIKYVIYLNYKALIIFVPTLYIEIKLMNFVQHFNSPHFSVLFQLLDHQEGAQSQLKSPQIYNVTSTIPRTLLGQTSILVF